MLFEVTKHRLHEYRRMECIKWVHYEYFDETDISAYEILDAHEREKTHYQYVLIANINTHRLTWLELIWNAKKSGWKMTLYDIHCTAQQHGWIINFLLNSKQLANVHL